MTQRIIAIDSPYFIKGELLTERLDLPALFGNHRVLALEIGCGTGHFVIQRARQQPEVNFLAIDIYNKGCWKTCKKLNAAQDIQNVRVMRVEARHLLEKGLAPQSLAAVYINCPDPWPKKRHRQRRLVDRTFLEILLDYLVPGGDFFFSTDFTDYASDVAGAMHDISGYINQLDTDWTNSLPGYPLSKYMQKFIEGGTPINFIHHKRDANPSHRRLCQSSFPCGFRVPRQRTHHD